MRKTQKFYVVLDKNGETSFEKLLTIVTTKKQVREYIFKHLYLTHIEHFRQWCKNHNYEDTTEVFADYLERVWGIEESYENYEVIERKLSPDEIAYSLRVSSACMPVGASYEYQEEQDTVKEALAQVYDN